MTPAPLPPPGKPARPLLHPLTGAIMRTALTAPPDLAQRLNAVADAVSGVADALRELTPLVGPPVSLYMIRDAEVGARSLEVELRLLARSLPRAERGFSCTDCGYMQLGGNGDPALTHAALSGHHVHELPCTCEPAEATT